MAFPASLPTLWRNHLANPENWDLYSPQFCYDVVPTCCGSQGLEEFKLFYQKHLKNDVSKELWKSRKIIHTHFSNDSVVEEAMVTILLQSGLEGELSWILPGINIPYYPVHFFVVRKITFAYLIAY
jgi:hypothetical protein